eukprot:TRINITY_DN6134_c0_g2_i1.p1 TRINITY_DN6134_c0_g2~~TRINITY_DN6134_c0_g2_i1.p1  ORF type:complete len:399 (-),score=100.86 TRINITY_DN6134_c0_g2_i1:102-1136(-)
MVREWTFETVFVDMKLEWCRSIASYRNHARNVASLYNFAQGDPKMMENVRKMDPMDMVSQEDRDNFETLKKLIHEALMGFGAEGAFIRLDSRSPKDAILSGHAVREVLQKEISSRPHADPYSEACQIDDVIAYFRSISKAQQIHTGEEAIDLLLRSNRVLEDLAKGELAQGSSFKSKLVIRKWTDIEPELEFRTFVVKGQITAITQYHKKCFVPSLKENKDKVEKLIFENFEKVKDLIRVPEGTFTIDFAVSQDYSRSVMIEINDPPPVAGTSLFLWEVESDRKILFEGPYEFRILESFVPWDQQTKDDIHPPLMEYIDSLRGRKAKGEEIVEEKEEKKNCSLQ